MDDSITIYRPEKYAGTGYLRLLAETLREIAGSRWLIYQLFRRDMSVLYKQSLAGIAWALVIPLASVATFFLLSGSGIFALGDIDVPYPVYALLGMAYWQIFSIGVVAGTNSLACASNLITRINFPKKSLVVSSMGQSLVAWAILTALVCALFIPYGIALRPELLLLPLMALPLVLLTLGISLIMSLFNCIMRDTGYLLSISMTFFMLATPVLYAKPATGILSLITDYNPLFYLVCSARELALTGQISELPGYAFSVVLSIALFAAGLIIFHLAEARIPERA